MVSLCTVFMFAAGNANIAG